MRRAKPTNAGLIEAAITACLDRRCLQGGDSAHPGRPPEEGPHGSMVLFARVCADELDWDKCSATLRHGAPPPDRPRKRGAARDAGTG